MASILNADNGVVSGSAGLKSNADSSGVLELQTNGTTAVTVNTNQSVSLTAGTANGVTYLNGSKVLTSGSALTFDGTALAVGTSTIGTNNRLTVDGGRLIVANGPTGSSSSATKGLQMYFDATNNQGYIFSTQSGVANYPLNVSSSTLSLASSLTTFTISGSEAMRLDSAGNLGLGVTPSAWISGVKVLDMAQAAYVGGSGGGGFIDGNSYIDSGNTARYKTTASATRYNFQGGIHSWSIAPSGTAGNAISFTQAMTLDANGNLGVGATSITPRDSGSRTLELYGTTSGRAAIKFTNATSGTGATDGMFLGYDDNLNFAIVNNESGVITFGTSNTERARIDTSGRLLVNLTSIISGENGQFQVAGSTNTAIGIKAGSNNYAASIYNTNNVFVGSITVGGSSTSYNTSSDYRLKNTIAPMTGGLEKVTKLKPVTYKWNIDGSVGEGFIAHELAQICPQAVTGEKDAIETYTDDDGNEQTRPAYQGIDVSFLVATLTAAIQEQQLLIQQLQADVAILKGVQQ